MLSLLHNHYSSSLSTINLKDDLSYRASKRKLAVSKETKNLLKVSSVFVTHKQGDMSPSAFMFGKELNLQIPEYANRNEVIDTVVEVILGKRSNGLLMRILRFLGALLFGNSKYSKIYTAVIEVLDDIFDLVEDDSFNFRNSVDRDRVVTTNTKF